MRLLLDEAKRGNIEILIPVVVFQETVRRFRAEMTSLQTPLARLERDFKRLGLGVEPLESVKKSLREQVSVYERYLRSTLEDHGACLLALPDIPHQKILGRFISRRKPISEDGSRGYQDVLIWETVLELLESRSDSLYFVTNNSKDFADISDQQSLAADLREDVAACCGDPQRVVLFSSLRSFVDKHVKPGRELPVQILKSAGPNRQNVSALLVQFLDGYAEQLVGASPDEVSGVDLAFEELIIESSEFSALTIEEMTKVSDEEVAVFCLVEFHATLDAYVMENGEDQTGPLALRRVEPESSYVRTTCDAVLSVDMEVTVDLTRGEVTEATPVRSSAEIRRVLGRGSPEIPGQTTLWDS
jgi:hypothetical protein